MLLHTPGRKRGKNAVLRTPPAYSFGQRHSNLFSSESGPGPGAYQSEKQYLVSSSSIHQPSYTIGGGRDVHVGQQSPGPSDYNPDAGKLLPYKPAFSLRGKPEGPGHRQRTPGPGHYTARTESKELGPHPTPSAYTFGLKWKGDREADRRPGPNAYLMDSTLSSVEASLKFRHEKRALREATSPGPGEYAATGADRPQPPAFTFGVSRKAQRPDTSPQQPGMSISAAGDQFRGGWSFGRAHRMGRGDLEAVPGPGAYQDSSRLTLRTAPAASLAGGRDIGRSQQSPGPSDYNPDAGKLLPHKPAISLGGKPEGLGHRQRTPGPGHYTARTESKALGPHPNASAYSFGLRWKGDKDADKKPAPNEYKVDSTLSKKGASLKFRHERRALREAAGPGPGAHDVLGCKTCGCNTKPGFTMGQQLKQQEPGSFSPGPAAYDYE